MILIAPFVHRLRALELGGAKAQWQENATTGITQVLTIIELQHQTIDRIYRDGLSGLSDRDGESSGINTPAAGNTPPVPRTLRDILWVDDHPVNNSYELDALRTIANVTVVTDTRQALQALRAGNVDALISDISRDEDEHHVPDAGLRLLRLVNEFSPPQGTPTFFYAGPPAVEQYGLALEKEGALVVTSSYRELFRALRDYEISTTSAAVRDMVSRIPDASITEGGERGIDYVVRLPSGRRIDLEVASWVTRPQMAAFADRVERLVAARDKGDADASWLLVRNEVIDERRREFAMERGVTLMSVDAVRAELANIRQQS